MRRFTIWQSPGEHLTTRPIGVVLDDYDRHFMQTPTHPGSAHIDPWAQVSEVSGRTVFSGRRLKRWERELGPALAGLPEFRRQTWALSSIEDRLCALNKLERLIAQAQGRQPSEVSSSRIPYAGFHAKARRIKVSSRRLARRSPVRAVKSLLHEDWHSTQSAAVKGQLSGVAQAVPRGWKGINRFPYRNLAMFGGASLDIVAGLSSLVAHALLPVAVGPIHVVIDAGTLITLLGAARYRTHPLERSAYGHANRTVKRMYPRQSLVKGFKTAGGQPRSVA